MGAACGCERLPIPVQSGYNGSGVTVGIIISSDVSRSDISTYLSYFQIPTTSRTITTESIDSASGIVAGERVDEATLDVETVAGLAPGANIIIYEIPALQNTYFNDAVAKAVSDGTPKVVSMSFGGCESLYTGGSAQTEEQMFASASSGITFVASSGDVGNQCTNSAAGTVGVNYPASDPNITAVGGNESSSSAGLTNPLRGTIASALPAAASRGRSRYPRINRASAVRRARTATCPTSRCPRSTMPSTSRPVATIGARSRTARPGRHRRWRRCTPKSSSTATIRASVRPTHSFTRRMRRPRAISST